MPLLLLRLLILLFTLFPGALDLAGRLRPAPPATPRCQSHGLRHTRGRRPHPARRVSRTPSRHAPSTCRRRAPLCRVQAPQGAAPAAKSFLEKTLTAHASAEVGPDSAAGRVPTRRRIRSGPARRAPRLAANTLPTKPASAEHRGAQRGECGEMNLVGYTDRLSAAPGDTVRFMVSSEHPRYRADLVRLIHGDESPAGPGYKEREVPSAINGEYPGRSRPIHSGSYVHVPSHPKLDALASFSVTAWIFPTTPTAGLQALVSRWTDDPAPQGFALVIGPNGDLGLHLADGRHPPVPTATDAPLQERVWTFVGASYHAPSGRVVLIQQPLRRWPVAPDRALTAHDTTAVDVTAPPGSPLLFAALTAGAPERTGPIVAPYNGKLDAPRLYNRALSSDELTALAQGTASRNEPTVRGEPARSLSTGRVEPPPAIGAEPTVRGEPVEPPPVRGEPIRRIESNHGLVAAWDFSLDIGGCQVTDTGPHQLHGQTVNMPTRGVTGHNFTGAQTSFRLAPREYGAIHFHDDDVEDVGWESDFQLTVPADLPSGVYAARLRAGDDEDYLPFCVRPARGTATSRIAVLMPTLTYVVYANFRDIDGGFWDHERVPNADPALHEPEYAYIRANGLPGLYERHSDGSGTTHVSHLRPILNMRPKFRYRVWAAPARFPADLYLIDWLEATGHQVDVITDHDLHAEGADLLSPYRVILTGSHPEYWTTDMLDGLRSYLDQGGHLMYLGGNGFFGVTTIDAERPHVAEVRRWGTSWPFEMPPAERVHSTTGEPGGTWRNRGLPPNGLVGIGSCAAGFDRGAHYVRQPHSFDPRAEFIFEGIGDDEPIGDCPSLVVRHGAAGYEMDRLDYGLGAPPHALLLASSVGHSERYAAFIDERLEFTQGKDGMLTDAPPQPGQVHSFVRADMVYFETPNGGGVFSVGSIAWRGCLSHNNYDNTISRVTANVLRRFATDR